jgi:D-3-phosphoglycerate dehydrogenase
VKILIVGDAFVRQQHFAKRVSMLTGAGHEAEIIQWGPDDRGELEGVIRGMERGSIPDDASLDTVKKRLEGKDALFVDFCPVPESMVKMVKLIGVSRTGVSNVALEAARNFAIPVINISGRNAVAVAEFTVAMMLAVSRNLAYAHHSLKLGQWKKDFSYEPVELETKQVGLIGFGEIGRLTAKKLSGFGCKIVYYDPYYTEHSDYAESAGFDEVIKNSDFVSVHVRLTEGTRGLIGRRELGLMKSSAFLINTARAEIVDAASLLAALREKKIRGAALDVFPEEPLTQDSEYLSLDNLVLTSHIAGSTPEALEKSVDLLYGNFIDYQKGSRDHVVK